MTAHTKIDVKSSKMACLERIWHRGSLTTPIVAKGLTETMTIFKVLIVNMTLKIKNPFNKNIRNT